MKRFKVWYEVEVIAYDYFLLDKKRGFVIILTEYTWDWLKFRCTENILSRSDNYDFFKCVEEINDYIIGNNLDKSKIKYPEIYEYVKP